MTRWMFRMQQPWALPRGLKLSFAPCYAIYQLVLCPPFPLWYFNTLYFIMFQCYMDTYAEINVIRDYFFFKEILVQIGELIPGLQFFMILIFIPVARESDSYSWAHHIHCSNSKLVKKLDSDSNSSIMTLWFRSWVQQTILWFWFWFWFWFRNHLQLCSRKLSAKPGSITNILPSRII